MTGAYPRISCAAQLLALPNADEARIRKASDVIYRQVRHMTELVDDLLDVSRVTRGLVTLDNAHFDLREVLHGAIEQAGPLLHARQHRLSLDIPIVAVPVLGDKTRLLQAVANLLNNAAKYTPAHGEITLSLKIENAALNICVSDNGTGIAPSLMPHIFDLFTQGERTPHQSQA